jgi:hypothetical protein
VKFRWVELSEAPCGFDVEWVIAFDVGERSGRNESGDVDGVWLLLIVEVEEAIANNGWEESFGHAVRRPW